MPDPAVSQASSQIGNAQSLFNAQQSSKGPLAVPVLFDFSIQGSYPVDLSILNSFATIDFVQTLYIDNSGNAGPVTVFNQISQQTIICPGYCQGWVPFLCPNPGRFTVSSTGTGKARFELCNFPVAPAVWGGSAGGAGNKYLPDGALVTSDENILAALDASLGPAYVGVIDEKLKPLVNMRDGVHNALDVNVLSGGGGGSSNANQVWTFNAGLVNGNNNPTTQGPGGIGLYCHVTDIYIYATPDLHNGVGQNAELSGFLNYPINWMKTSFYMPAAAPATLGVGLIPIVQMGGFDIKAGAASQAPYLYWGGTASTGGALVAEIYGYYSTT